MNTGIVASRYAKALLDFAREKGSQAQVYADACALVAVLSNEQELPKCVESVSDDMRRFLKLVIAKGRVEFLPIILASYIKQYRKAEGITKARLVTAVPSEELEAKLTALLCKDGFTHVEFETVVNPDLIGGFVLQVEDKRLDASLSTQLQILKYEFEEKNKRIL